MRYVFIVIWLGFVLKAIVTAMRHGKNQSRQDDAPPSEQVPSTVVFYRGQTLVLPKFVDRQDAFVKKHLVDVYQQMVDFYFMKFTNGGEGDYVLTLQEHRTLAVGGIDDGLIAELREDAQCTAAELVAKGLDDDADSADGFDGGVGEWSETVISVSDDTYAPNAPARDEHAGESYAAPIPPPHESPMAGTMMASGAHADSHVAPVNVKDTLPEHGPSMAAKHADSHIATTEAEKTPMTTGHSTVRRSPYSSIIPHGEKELQKAMVLKEILGDPKGLQ